MYYLICFFFRCAFELHYLSVFTEHSINRFILGEKNILKPKKPPVITEGFCS